jgi:hypothetical protein
MLHVITFSLGASAGFARCFPALAAGTAARGKPRVVVNPRM